MVAAEVGELLVRKLLLLVGALMNGNMLLGSHAYIDRKVNKDAEHNKSSTTICGLWAASATGGPMVRGPRKGYCYLPW